MVRGNLVTVKEVTVFTEAAYVPSAVMQYSSHADKSKECGGPWGGLLNPGRKVSLRKIEFKGALKNELGVHSFEEGIF